MNPLVCINKYDINEDNTRQIETSCFNQGIKVASKIPFDDMVTRAMIRGLPIVEYNNSNVSHEIELLWHSVVSRLENN